MGELSTDESEIKHNRDDNLVHLLNQANAVTILLYLLDHKVAFNNTFRRPPFAMTWKVIFRLFDEFYDLGLLQYTGNPSRPQITLSKKGIMLAQKVAAAVEKMEPILAIPAMEQQSPRSPSQDSADGKKLKTSPLVKLFSSDNPLAKCTLFLYEHPEGVDQREIGKEFRHAHYTIGKLNKIGIIKNTGCPSAPKIVLNDKGIEVARELKRLSK